MTEWVLFLLMMTATPEGEPVIRVEVLERFETRHECAVAAQILPTPPGVFLTCRPEYSA